MEFNIGCVKYKNISNYIINILKDTNKFYSVKIPKWFKTVEVN